MPDALLVTHIRSEWPQCPACNRVIVRKSKACRFCGVALKWATIQRRRSVLERLHKKYEREASVAEFEAFESAQDGQPDAPMVRRRPRGMKWGVESDPDYVSEALVTLARPRKWWVRKARRMVYTAIRSGRLLAPNMCRGDGCGQGGKLTAHHLDPLRRPLYVVWLCWACHQRIHHLEKQEANVALRRELEYIEKAMIPSGGEGLPELRW